MKRIFWILLLALSFFLGGYLTFTFYKPKTTIQSKSDVNVVYEEIKKVCKLVTVEGIYSERFDSLNNKEVPIFYPLPYKYSFPKEATIFVTGKVLVGYNMAKITIKIDETTKQIILSDIPKAEVLAIDHDVKYENIEESWFNKFTAEDFTSLNKSAKEAIRNSGASNELLQKATFDGNQMIETMRLIADLQGYKLIIKGDSHPSLLD